MAKLKKTVPPGTRFIGSTGYWFVVQDDASIAAEHRLIWQRERGEIPERWHIHHRNCIRSDNRLENLECVDPQTHRRLHEGHRRVDGTWLKTCTGCGVEQPEDDFPTKCYRDGVRMTRGNCRACERARQREKKGWAGGESPLFGRHHGSYAD